jgi:L-seryl-tRNA(Ser) seleniumtransferase
MISLTPKQLKAQAERWVDDVGYGKVIEGQSTVGGGSLPGETLPTSLVALNTKHAEKLLAKLRAQHPPIIARAEDGRVLLDPRTVQPEEEGALLVGLKNVLR